jgi:hypothetical protein
MQCRTVVEGVHIFFDAVGIDVDDEIKSQALGGFIPERNHVAEFPAGIDMHQGEGWFGGIKGLHGEMQHDG